jgi:ketosteroid isomerase-like protein
MSPIRSSLGRLPRRMRLALELCALMVMAGVGTWGGISACAQSASPEESVLRAHRAWVKAYENTDVDAMMSLLDVSPQLVIFHPMVHNRFHGGDEIRAGLTRMFQRLGKATWTEAHLQTNVEGDVAWITSNMALESNDLKVPIVGRATEIWLRTGEEWRLVHAHYSADPSANPPQSYQQSD